MMCVMVSDAAVGETAGALRYASRSAPVIGVVRNPSSAFRAFTKAKCAVILKEWVNGWVKTNLQNGQLVAIYKKYHGVDIPVEQLLKGGN